MTTRFAGTAAAVGAVLLLGGCSTIPWFKPRRPPPVEIVIPPVAPDEAGSKVAAPSAKVLPRPKPQSPGRVRLTPQTRLARPLPGAREFVGLDAAQVRNLIGKPSLLRKDKDAEVWHYRNMDCTLFLFFYDKPGEGMRVSHVDMANTNRARPAVTESARRQLLESCVAATVMTHGSRGI